MGNEKYRYWQQILFHFERKLYIQNGLTIPFLIGARSMIEPNEEILSVADLIRDMSEIGCTMLKCDYIGEFVIGSLGSDTAQIKDIHYKSFKNLVVTDDSVGFINKLDELIEYLETSYQPIINAGQYSKEEGEWRGFSNKDSRRVMEVLKNIITVRFN